jgi:glucose-1-phosphate thymidylyltransferase
MSDLTLVVPAAGLGRRLASLYPGQPKCLLQVADRPILHHVLDAGLKAQPDRIIIVVNMKGGSIIEAIGAQYAGLPVSYIVQSSPLGLAHAVTLAAPCMTDVMLVINGDEIYVGGRYLAARQYFTAREADAVVGYLHTAEPARISIGYGMELATDGRVLRLEEKPLRPWNDLLGVGFWLLKRSWFACYERTPLNPARGERDFVAVIQAMLQTGARVHGFELAGRFFNINTEADLRRARSELQHASAPIYSVNSSLAAN